MHDTYLLTSLQTYDLSVTRYDLSYLSLVVLTR